MNHYVAHANLGLDEAGDFRSLSVYWSAVIYYPKPTYWAGYRE